MTVIHIFGAARLYMFFQRKLIRYSAAEVSAGQVNLDAGHVGRLVDMKNSIFPLLAWFQNQSTISYGGVGGDFSLVFY